MTSRTIGRAAHAVMFFTVLAFVLVLAPADAQDAPPAAGADQPRQPFPHVHIDFKNKIIDLDAKVVLREGDWIELVGCAPNTREHESIVTLSAKPSHVHGALLVIGLKPGSPIRWKWVGKVAHMIPPTGSRVAVSFVMKKDGKTVEIPAHHWIVNQQTKKPMKDNIWLFTGSKIVEAEGKRYYKADVEGNIISVVNFGDEVLGLPTELTSQTDEGALGINTKKVPAVGTELKLRLRVAKPVKGAKGKAGGGADNKAKPGK